MSPAPSTPVILDGAWATELQKRGLAIGEPAELWNLSRPDDVEAVARSYVEAGAQIILANTFQANPPALRRSGFADEVVAINREGARISRRAAEGTDVQVFGSIGPTGSSGLGEQRVVWAFAVQAMALRDGGADGLALETFTDLNEARLAVRAARAAGLPIVVSFHFDGRSGEPRLFSGETPEEAARAMADEGAWAVGANCGTSPDEFDALCRRLKSATDLPIWIKPNAGIPKIQEGRLVYPISPEAFAARLAGWIEAGASFIGGCCGTGPEFIRALVAARDSSISCSRPL